jgi:hypothetical protein
MDNDAMMVSGGAILKEIYFSRCPDFSVRGALRATNELVAVWLEFSGFSDTDVNISLPLLHTGRHNISVVSILLNY